MKRICFVLGVLVLFIFFANSVLAKEIWVIEDEGLVPYQREENCPIYPIPPEGVSAETAGKLIRGEISECTIDGKTEKKWVLKPFWHLRKITIIPQTQISYSKGLWIPKEIPSQKKEETNWVPIVLFFIIPAIFLLVISIENQNTEFGDKSLFIFYGVTFIIIIFSALIGYSVSKIQGALSGIFAGLFIGGLAGRFTVGDIDGTIIGAVTGFLVGVFTGTVASNLVVTKGYLVFIAFICLFSFITAKVIKKLWRAEKALIH